jgi:hypothetical protein
MKLQEVGENCIMRSCMTEVLKGGDHLENQGVDWRIILKSILGK